MESMQRNIENIPEISIQVYKFKLFEKDVYAMLVSNQLEAFKLFIEKLNNNEIFESAKDNLIDTLMKGKNAPVIAVLGSNFIEMLSKIEEEYKIIAREHKIDQITDTNLLP